MARLPESEAGQAISLARQTISSAGQLESKVGRAIFSEDEWQEDDQEGVLLLATMGHPVKSHPVYGTMKPRATGCSGPGVLLLPLFLSEQGSLEEQIHETRIEKYLY